MPSTVSNHRLNLVLSLALEGRLYPPSNAGRGHPRPRCLVRIGATTAARVAVADGGAGDGVVVLGNVSTLPMPGAVPFWTSAQGYLLTHGMAPPEPSLVDVTRWVTGPLTDAVLPFYRRLRSTAGRLRRLRSRPSWDAASLQGTPAGFLYGGPADGRVPLYAAWHRAGLGQAVAGDPGDPVMSPCHAPLLLGYVDEIVETSDSTSQ